MSRLPRTGSGVAAAGTGSTVGLAHVRSKSLKSGGPNYPRFGAPPKSPLSPDENVEMDSEAISPMSMTNGSSIGSPRSTLRKPNGIHSMGGGGLKQGPAGSGMARPAGKASGAPAGNSANFRVGERVRVDSMGLEGTLRFLGPTKFKVGTWAGVEVDQQGTGKNDGSVQGIAYFQCPPQSGIFVLPSKLSRPDGDGQSKPPTSNRPNSLRGPGLRKPGGANASGPQSPQQPTNVHGKPIHFQPTSRANRFVGVSAQQYKRNSLLLNESGVNINGYATPNTPTRRIGMGLGIHQGDNEPEGEGHHSENRDGNATEASSKNTELIQQIQSRAETLEAENQMLKLEVQQGKARLAAGELLERGIVGEAHAMLGRDEEVASLRERVERLLREKVEVDQERERLRRELSSKKRQSTDTTANGEDGEQVTKLKEALTQRDAKIKEIQQTIEDLTKQADALEAELAQQKANGKDREEASKLNDQVKDLEAAMLETDHALSAKEDIERELREQLDQLSRERDYDKARHNHKAGDSAHYHEDMRRLERQLEDKATEMGQLSARLDRASTEHEKEKAMLTETIKQLREAGQETISLYEGQIAELEKARSEAVEMMDSKSGNECHELKERLEKMEKEAQSARQAGAQTIETYESKVKELEKELETAQALVHKEKEDDLRLQLEKAKEEVQLVKEEAALKQANLDKRLQEIQATIEAATTAAAAAASRGGEDESTTEENLQLQRDLQKINDERHRLEEQVKSLSTQLQELKTTKSELEQRMIEIDNVAEKAHANTRQSISSMDDLMRDRDNELAKLRDLTASLQAEKNKMVKELEELRQSAAAAAKGRGGGNDDDDDSDAVLAMREELEDLRARLQKAQKAKAEAAEAMAAIGDAGDGTPNPKVDALQNKIVELNQENRETKQENQRLLDIQESLAEAHRQVESECVKLMDELERLHDEQSLPPSLSVPEVDAGIKLEEVEEDDPDNPMPPEQRRLLALLKEKQAQLENQQRAHQRETRRLQSRVNEIEQELRGEIDMREKDISDLEILVESKIFREADLEEQLDQKVQMAKKLQRQLEGAGTGQTGDTSALLEPGSTTDGLNSRSQSGGRDHSLPYCEICEEDGHEIMSCPAVMGTAVPGAGAEPKKPTANIEDEDLDQPYCDNCEAFGQHWTEDCPSVDAIF